MIPGPIESWEYVRHSAKPHLTGFPTGLLKSWLQLVATGVMGHSRLVQGGPVAVAMPGDCPRTGWGPVASF